MLDKHCLFDQVRYWWSHLHLAQWFRGRVVDFNHKFLGSSLATMSRFGLSPGVSFFIKEKDIGFDLSGIKGYQRVRTDELIIFAKDKLELRPGDIRSVQVHPVGPYAFIGFNDVDRMRDVYDGIKEGVLWPGKGEVFPFLCTESYTEVKLKGLEPGSDPIAVSLMMEEYGNVLSCKEYMARIPAMKTGDSFPTGDFSLRIQLATKIPRFLPQAREGNVWLATYEGQDDECWRCWESGHEKRECKSKPYAPGFIKDQRHYRDLHLRGGEDISTGSVATKVARLETGEKGIGKAGSSPSGESNPPGQVASSQTGSASGEVPPGQVASQVVGEGESEVDGNNDYNLESLFPAGNTQELNTAMDDYENDEAFAEGSTQLFLNALDRAEAGSSGVKTKTTRNRSWSSDGQSPKRLLNKDLGNESDRQRGYKDAECYKAPMVTPADRLAWKNKKTAK